MAEKGEEKQEGHSSYKSHAVTKEKGWRGQCGALVPERGEEPQHETEPGWGSKEAGLMGLEKGNESGRRAPESRKEQAVGIQRECSTALRSLNRWKEETQCGPPIGKTVTERASGEGAGPETNV